MDTLSSSAVEPASGTLRQPEHHERTQDRLRNTTDDVWRTCECCGTQKKTMQKCGGCRLAHYCCLSCQRKHWKDHKGCCSPDAALPRGRRYIITRHHDWLTLTATRDADGDNCCSLRQAIPKCIWQTATKIDDGMQHDQHTIPSAAAYKHSTLQLKHHVCLNITISQNLLVCSFWLEAWNHLQALTFARV